MTGDFGKSDGSHGGVWECPDLFPLKINGKTKWVLLLSINPGGANGGSATQYFIGDFDGKTFKNDNAPNEVLWFDYGRDNYAGVTWANAPKNRRIFLGWMSNWDYAQKVPTEKWRSAMTLPRELSLRETEKGLRVVQTPVKESQKLRNGQFLSVKNYELNKELSIGDGKSSLVEMELEIDLAKIFAKEFGIELSNSKGESYKFIYNVETKKFTSDRTNSGKKDFSDLFGKNEHFATRLSQNKRLKLHLFFDKASAEMFADDGEIAMTDIFFPTEDFTKFKIYADGKVYFTKANAWNLKSIWR
jgi:fructan beta-fructosidase